MPLPQAVSSVTSLVGALQVNYALGLAGTTDVGGKLAQCVSAINQMALQVSYMQTLLSASWGSGVTFSGISTTAFSGSPATIVNFTSTW